MRDALAARDEMVERFFQPSWDRRKALVTAAEAGELRAEDLPNDLFTGHDPQSRTSSRSTPCSPCARRRCSFTRPRTRRPTCCRPSSTRWICGVAAHPEDASLVTDADFPARAIQESIRLHPTVPQLYRIATADVVLPSGLRVRKGERVAVSIYHAGRDETVFGPAADRFDPHRSVPERIDRYALGFGQGPHLCIGKPLVLGDERPGRERLGAPRAILLELYRRGVRPDRSRPVLKPQNTKDGYASFPWSSMPYESISGSGRVRRDGRLRRGSRRPCSGWDRRPASHRSR